MAAIGIDPQAHEGHSHRCFQKCQAESGPFGDAGFPDFFPLPDHNRVDANAGVIHEDMTVDEARVDLANRARQQDMLSLCNRVDTQVLGEMIQGSQREHGKGRIAPDDDGGCCVHRSIPAACHQHIAAVTQSLSRTGGGIPAAQVFADRKALVAHALFRGT